MKEQKHTEDMEERNHKRENTCERVFFMQERGNVCMKVKGNTLQHTQNKRKARARKR